MNKHQTVVPGGNHVRPITTVFCFAGSAVRPRQLTHGTASSKCRCRAAQDSKPPIVDDADITVLPPPPTGSQYAWRNSWRGSAFNNGGGNGGKGGRPQSHTRDWGRGPRSSLLFVLMYRVRMLLLYGVWITVLYGAAHAITDLAKSIAKLAVNAAGHAGKWATTLRSSSNTAEDSSSSSSGDFSNGASVSSRPASDLQAAAVPADATDVSSTGCHHRDSSPLAAEATFTAAADVNKADADDAGASNPATTVSAAAESPTKSESPVSSSWLSRVHDRPGAQPFNGLMSVVIPMYLMMMGSVLFFASM